MGDVVVSSNMGLIMIDPQFMVMLKGNKNSFHHESAGVDMPNPPGFVSTGVDSGLYSCWQMGWSSGFV